MMRNVHYSADSQSEGTAKRKSMHQLPTTNGLQIDWKQLLHMALHELQLQGSLISAGHGPQLATGSK
jgi:hypothetical protein